MRESLFPEFSILKNYNNYVCKLKNIREREFKRTEGTTYVDHAAATLYSEKQISSVFSALNVSILGNPHSRHLPSDSVTESIEATRNRILRHFNTNDEEYDLIFTSGATDAIKIVGESFLWTSSSTSKTCGEKPKSQGALIYTQVNHTSVLGIRESAKKKGAKIYCLPIERIEESLNNEVVSNADENCNCLFVYPAQCNYSGSKYPLSWIDRVHRRHLNVDEKFCICSAPLKTDYKEEIWKPFVLLDAASYVATSPLDLSKYKPDFVPVSFYKMFGFPTGLGCLLVNRRAWKQLQKPYFGGGTVQMADSRNMSVKRRNSLHESFEDGTLPFLDIFSLQHGFDTLYRITGGMKHIELHVFSIARYCAYNLRSLRHENGAPVAEVYSENVVLTVENHGSIVNFNVKDSEGNSVGYSQIEKVASLYNIYLRTGCVCNPGACQRYLNISSEKLKEQFDAGHVCGDANDVVNGQPTGSVRVSFGYMSTYEDADMVLKMVKECFVQGTPKIDISWLDNAEKLPDSEDSTRFPPRCASDIPQRDSAYEILSEKNEISFGCTEETSKSKEIIHLDKTRLKFSEELQLTDIIVYPVKSCAGICVPQWSVGARGLEFDRQWMVVTSAGVTLTQKRMPKLSLLKPIIDLQRNVMILSFKDCGSIEVSLELPATSVLCEDTTLCGGRVCGDRVKGIDCGDSVAQWLSEAVQMKGLRLIRQTESRKCKLTPHENGENKILSLANESQYLIIHRPSMRLLIRQMKEKQSHSMSEEELKLRLRPNFVIDGGGPYAEDFWKEFTIGGHCFKVLGGCTRCQMICVDPETGDRSKEPMITLGATRGAAMKFGVHASYEGSLENEGAKEMVLYAGSTVHVQKDL